MVIQKVNASNWFLEHVVNMNYSEKSVIFHTIFDAVHEFECMFSVFLCFEIHSWRSGKFCGIKNTFTVITFEY